MGSLTDLTITDAGRAFRRNELSPLDLTRAHLERIERLNPEINAYITVTTERALEDARRAADELARGQDRGPLHGIPIALKDLYATAGIRTTAGARILSTWIPDTDSTVARRLREAGSVLLGKLNTHEFAYGVTTDNPHFGRTRNPWDPERIPGGSSGGSGAAAIARMAMAAMGTDTGGSIRIPAALCGVVGLKPTYGRVSKAGVVPLSWIFDHTGPLTRTVRDAALVLQAIAGYDAADPSSARVAVDDYGRDLERGLSGVRVGVPRAYFYERLDDEVRRAVEQAIDLLRELGAGVEDVCVPDIEPAILSLFGVVLAEAQEIHAESLRTRAGDFGRDVGALLAQPAPPTAELMRAFRRVYALSEAMRRELERVDVLVTPTTPVPAVRFGEESVRRGGVEEPTIFAMIRCTSPFNATHLPALSMPCGFTRAGLPVGLQIAGRPFDEAVVLRVGHAFEQATEWHRRTPERYS